MKRMIDLANRLAFCIIIAGTVIALITSLAPSPTGAYELSFGFVLLGITPYFIYGIFLDVLKNNPWVILCAGIVLIALDLFARVNLRVIHVIPTDLIPPLYLCTALTLLVLPGGALLGKLFSLILMQDRSSNENS